MYFPMRRGRAYALPRLWESLSDKWRGARYPAAVSEASTSFTCSITSGTLG